MLKVGTFQLFGMNISEEKKECIFIPYSNLKEYYYIWSKIVLQYFYTFFKQNLHCIYMEQ